MHTERMNDKRQKQRARRILAVLLSLLMMLSVWLWQMPAAYAAEPTPEPISTQTAVPSPEATSEPTPEPAPEPTAPATVSTPESEPATAAEGGVTVTTSADGYPCAAGEVIVVFEERTTVAAAASTLSELNVSTSEEVAEDMKLVDVPAGATISGFIDQLEDQHEVAYAQPNYMYILDPSEAVPESAEDNTVSVSEATLNDPSRTYQWHLERIGAYEAWDKTWGDSNVRVAVLDTGIDLDHPDLAGQIVAYTDTQAHDNNPDDDNGHGTHVAGIIAAKANNGIGGAGIAPGAKLIAVDVFSRYSGSVGYEWGASTADIVEGLQFAVANGADIINMSLGSYATDTAEINAVESAISAGIVVVAAAGNENVSSTHYPSDLPSVIGVMSTDSSDVRDSDSDYGPEKDMTAPGESIYSTYLKGEYRYMSGTSMASPVVAGVAALILSMEPTLSADQVKNILCSTADDKGAVGKDNYYGFGRVNADAAVLMAASGIIPAVNYRSHVQSIGWQRWRSAGGMSGTSGQALRLEAMQIQLEDVGGGVEYCTHVQNIGWMPWVSNGAVTGTEGLSYRLEAIAIRLTGEAAALYDIYYRVHAQNIGWMGWAKNGQSSGTAGYAYRLEAIEIELIPKGSAAPGSTANPFDQKTGVSYQSHVQSIGWQDWKSNGVSSGTYGQSLRLEAMNIQLDGIDGGIQYRTHVQNIGWMGWVSDGALSGTSGQSLRLEAIELRLTGNAAALYDVYYRVHAQNVGWMGWAKNGERSGTAGYAYRLEAIVIRLVPKGGAAPGSTAGAFIQK